VMNTRLTDLLGIRIPLVSAPMYYASTPQMAAAAAAAGAFGFIAAGFTTSRVLVEEIRTARTLLDIRSQDPVPIGVGLLGWILDTTETSEDPRIPSVLAERPSAIWFAFGTDLGRYVAKVRAYDAERDHKTIIFVIINNVEEALRAATDWGVDVLVVQGNEAGGHGRGDAPPLLSLLPSVIRALSPAPIIIAAGGVSTGAQIAALLALGADGAVLGSRLLATPECMYSELSKEIIIKSTSSCTVRSDVFDEVNRTAMWPEGINGRAIANDLLIDAQAGLGLEERLKRYDEGQAKKASNRLVIWAGDAVACIHGRETTQEIIHQLHAETVAAMKELKNLD